MRRQWSIDVWSQSQKWFVFVISSPGVPPAQILGAQALITCFANTVYRELRLWYFVFLRTFFSATCPARLAMIRWSFRYFCLCRPAARWSYTILPTTPDLLLPFVYRARSPLLYKYVRIFYIATLTASRYDFRSLYDYSKYIENIKRPTY